MRAVGVSGGVEMSTGTAAARELIAQTEAVYMDECVAGKTQDSARVEEWFEKREEEVYTSYHEIPKLDAATAFTNW